MNIRKVKSLLLLITLSLISGCTKKQQSCIPFLRPLTSYIDYHRTQRNITLRVKRLSPEECKPFLGSRAPALFKKRRSRKPIYPIQISVTNRADFPIILKPEYIHLKLTPYAKVLSRIEHNTFLNVFGTLLASVFIGGSLIAAGTLAFSAGGIFAFLLGTNSLFVAGPLVVAGVGAFVVTPFFLVIGTPISTTIRGVQVVQENQLRYKEVAKRTLTEGITIKPLQTVDTIIFVSQEDYSSHFKVNLGDQKFFVNLGPLNQKA